jgi:hypothetical protein
VVAALWLVLGVAVWNGFYDLYVESGSREYLRRVAEAEVGWSPRPVMADIMRHASHRGAVVATLWAVLIVAAGWLTILVCRSRR